MERGSILDVSKGSLFFDFDPLVMVLYALAVAYWDSSSL